MKGLYPRKEQFVNSRIDIEFYKTIKGGYCMDETQEPVAAPEVQKPIQEAELQCTITRERLMFVIQYNTEMIERAKRLLELLNQHPELDIDFAKMFGVQPPPKGQLKV